MVTLGFDDNFPTEDFCEKITFSIRSLKNNQRKRRFAKRGHKQNVLKSHFRHKLMVHSNLSFRQRTGSSSLVVSVHSGTFVTKASYIRVEVAFSAVSLAPPQ